MLRPHHDQHNVLADVDLAIPVQDQDLDDIEILQRPLPDFPQRLLGHALIMLEGNGAHGVALGAIPRRPQEDRDAADARRPAAHAVNLGIHRKILPLDADQHGIAGRVGPHGCPAGEGRQQRDLITIPDLGVFVGDLLVHRH